MTLNYFSEDEFHAATPSCQLSDMDEKFMHRLEAARVIAGIPFVINSAYRTVDYEKSKGRDGTSSHTKGLAVDIKTDNSRERYIILDALIRTGFHRIGVGDNFLHVDDDPGKDSRVIWDYYD